MWRLVFAAILSVALQCSAHAGGNVQVKFAQDADCAAIASWGLYVAPITTTAPNPSPPATPVATIQNIAPLTCGPNVTVVRAISGVGNTRFWLRAQSNSSPAVASDYSNAVDRPVPLAAPTLTDVLP